MTKVATIKGTIVTETQKAILIEIEGNEHWFPLSTVWKITRSSVIGSDEIEVDHWIAKKKELAE